MVTVLEEAFKQFEDKLDQLLETNQRVAQQNKTLQESEAALTEERASLMRKNDLAKSKIEAMITRLKSLEQS